MKLSKKGQPFGRPAYLRSAGRLRDRPSSELASLRSAEKLRDRSFKRRNYNLNFFSLIHLAFDGILLMYSL